MAFAEPIISLARVSLCYPGPPPVDALREIDFYVRENEYVAIMGPSGSGKSSLLNVLGLLVRPTSGAYRLAGEDTASLSDAELASLRARRIGFVFQEYYLLSYRTALENVALAQLYWGRTGQGRRAAASEMLQRVGLGHRLQALPSTLSGGERQRVVIARALMGRPGLLLCDEPTGQLDSTSTERILDLIGEIHETGQTVVVITHDEEVAKRAQRVERLADGKLRLPAAPRGALADAGDRC